jgi:Gram-negative bacterial TonB protein C-terminal
MSALLLILCILIQGESSPTKWDCVGKSDRAANKQITRLKTRDLNERVVSCKTPVLPGNVDATGAVLVEVLVNETGEVECLRAIDGPSIIRGAALAAAKKWKFKPLVVDGTAKPFSGFISVHVSWDVEDMEKHCPNQRRAEQIVGPERRERVL